MCANIKWKNNAIKSTAVMFGKIWLLSAHFDNVHRRLWVRKIVLCCHDNMRWVNALVDISWGYLIFPFLSKMLSGKLQNLKGLLPQIYCSAIYSEEQRRTLVRSRRRSRAPRNCLEISRDTQCKTSSSRFQKETWHIESGFDQTA